MVGWDNADISIPIPVVFRLKKTVHRKIDCALKAQQQEEEKGFLVCQGHFFLTPSSQL